MYRRDGDMLDNLHSQEWTMQAGPQPCSAIPEAGHHKSRAEEGN